MPDVVFVSEEPTGVEFPSKFTVRTTATGMLKRAIKNKYRILGES